MINNKKYIIIKQIIKINPAEAFMPKCDPSGILPPHKGKTEAPNLIVGYGLRLRNFEQGIHTL